jgi:serine/threonine protein kinase
VAEVVDFIQQMLQVLSFHTSLFTSTHSHCVKQGLKYLHDLNVAHRYLTLLLFHCDTFPSDECSDCYIYNIMMDATDLIPGGFHPRFQDRSPDFSRRVKPRKRSCLKTPVRYYFIDFGLSSWFRKADSNGTKGCNQVDKSLRRLVTGNKCQDPCVAEMYSQRPYDPFVLDVGILGNVFRRTLVTVRPYVLCSPRGSRS